MSGAESLVKFPTAKEFGELLVGLLSNGPSVPPGSPRRAELPNCELAMAATTAGYPSPFTSVVESPVEYPEIEYRSALTKSGRQETSVSGRAATGNNSPRARPLTSFFISSPCIKDASWEEGPDQKRGHLLSKDG